MNDFTASNGVTLTHSPEGHILLPKSVMGLGEDTQQALREFFQAEADERLGRWRWPEHPEYVVYAPRDFTHYVRVLDESGAIWDVVYREGVETRGALTARAARAYFDVHPEPKPWHDAQPGELWVIRLADQEEIGVSVEAFEPGADVFQVPGGESISITRPSIVAGRRIWPEVSA